MKIYHHTLSFISFKILINNFYLEWEYCISHWDLEPYFPSPFCKVIPFLWTTLVRSIVKSRRKYSPAEVFPTLLMPCISVAVIYVHDTRRCHQPSYRLYLLGYFHHWIVSIIFYSNLPSFTSIFSSCQLNEKNGFFVNVCNSKKVNLLDIRHILPQADAQVNI